MLDEPQDLPQPSEADPSDPMPVSPPKRSTHAVSSPLSVKVETYEGPLDLLLDLIRKQ